MGVVTATIVDDGDKVDAHLDFEFVVSGCDVLVLGPDDVVVADGGTLTNLLCVELCSIDEAGLGGFAEEGLCGDEEGLLLVDLRDDCGDD